MPLAAPTLDPTAVDRATFPRVAPRAVEGDGALISRMLSNDSSAWRTFQSRYDRLIVRCIKTVTRRFASTMVEEDVREVHASLYVSLLRRDMHKLRIFDPRRGTRLSSWVGLLAVNEAYDHLRVLRRERLVQRASLAEAMEIAAADADPFELASERERAVLTQEALAAFSEKDRTFAQLYFAECLAPDVIALKLQISINSVYSKKHKIRTRLASALDPYSGNEGAHRSSPD